MNCNAPIAALLAIKGHEVHRTAASATVREAVHDMNTRRIGALVVTRAGKPIGMFTERDVLIRVVAAGRNPDITRVEEVMSTNLTVITPETSIEQAMLTITERRHRHLPVVDPEGRLLGMVSIGDLMRWMVRDRETYIENLSEYIWGAYSAGTEAKREVATS